jgi:beta-glucosidase
MDLRAIAPRFEYGFGLSYTNFTYSGLSITSSGTSKVITFTVKNTGAIAGTEKPQLYLGYPPAAGEPPKVLRGFDEVPLAAGASQQVSMTVGAREMRFVLVFFCRG